MKNFIKYTLAGVVILGFLVCVAIFGLVMYFDPNDHKDTIIAQVKEKTGRELSLGGDIKLSYYPWLGIEINQVTLSNTGKEFSSLPFLHADLIALHLKTLPLLKQQYELDTVLLHGVQVNLVKNEQGMGNWGSSSPVEEKETAKPTQSTRLTAVALGGLDVRDFNLTWHDQGSGQIVKISDLAVTADKLITNKPTALSMNMSVSANKPEIESDWTIKSTGTYDLSAGNYTLNPFEIMATLTGNNIPNGKTELKLVTGLEFNAADDTLAINDLKFNTLGAAMQAQMLISRLSAESPKIAGTLAVASEDLLPLAKVVEIEPATTELAKLRHRDFNARIEAELSGDTINIAELKVNVLGAVAKAKLDLKQTPAGLSTASGHIDLHAEDLTRLLSVAGIQPLANQLSKLQQRNLRLNADFDADLTKGNINLPTLSGESLGITVNGQLKAADFNKQGNISGHLSITGEKLSALLTALDQAALGASLDRISLDLGVQGDSTNISLHPFNLNAVVHGKHTPSLPVSLTADVKANIKAQTLVVRNITLQGLGLDIKAQLNAEQIRQAPVFSGELAVAKFDPRALMSKLRQKLPSTSDDSVLKEIALDAKVSGTANSLKIEDLNLSLDDTRAKGSLSVIDFARPQIEFETQIDDINLDRYLPPQAKAQPATSETAAAPTKIPVKTLRALNIQGNASIGKLVVSNINLHNINLGLDARNGKITLDPLAVDLYEGKYQGSVHIDTVGEIPQLGLKTQLSGLQLQPLLKDYLQRPEVKFKGVIDLQGDMTASGLVTDQLKQSMNGQASISLSQGVIPGIDIVKIIKQATIILASGKKPATETKGGATEFGSLVGTFNIKNGVITNDDLRLEAPGFSVTGSGTMADLPSNSMNYELRIESALIGDGDDKGLDIGKYKIPIRCQGQFQSLSCQPEYDELLELAVKTTLKEAIEKGGEVKDIIKDSLKKLVPF